MEDRNKSNANDPTQEIRVGDWLVKKSLKSDLYYYWHVSRKESIWTPPVELIPLLDEIGFDWRAEEAKKQKHKSKHDHKRYKSDIAGTDDRSSAASSSSSTFHNSGEKANGGGSRTSAIPPSAKAITAQNKLPFVNYDDGVTPSDAGRSRRPVDSTKQPVSAAKLVPPAFHRYSRDVLKSAQLAKVNRVDRSTDVALQQPSSNSEVGMEEYLNACLEEGLRSPSNGSGKTLPIVRNDDKLNCARKSLKAKRSSTGGSIHCVDKAEKVVENHGDRKILKAKRISTDGDEIRDKVIENGKNITEKTIERDKLKAKRSSFVNEIRPVVPLNVAKKVHPTNTSDASKAASTSSRDSHSLPVKKVEKKVNTSIPDRPPTDGVHSRHFSKVAAKVSEKPTQDFSVTKCPNSSSQLPGASDASPGGDRSKRPSISASEALRKRIADKRKQSLVEGESMIPRETSREAIRMAGASANRFSNATDMLNETQPFQPTSPAYTDEGNSPFSPVTAGESSCDYSFGADDNSPFETSGESPLLRRKKAQSAVNSEDPLRLPRDYFTRGVAAFEDSPSSMSPRLGDGSPGPMNEDVVCAAAGDRNDIRNRGSAPEPALSSPLVPPVEKPDFISQARSRLKNLTKSLGPLNVNKPSNAAAPPTPSPSAQAQLRSPSPLEPICATGSGEDDEAMEVDDWVDAVNELRRGTEYSAATNLLLERNPPSLVKNEPEVCSPTWIVLDTNVLLSDLALCKLVCGHLLKDGSRFAVVIPWIVIQELDHCKSGNSKNGKSKALIRSSRKVISYILESVDANSPYIKCQTSAQDLLDYQSLNVLCNDDRILKCALQWRSVYFKLVQNVIICSNDKNLLLKSKVHGIEAITSQNLHILLKRVAATSSTQHSTIETRSSPDVKHAIANSSLVVQPRLSSSPGGSIPAELPSPLPTIFPGSSYVEQPTSTTSGLLPAGNTQEILVSSNATQSAKSVIKTPRLDFGLDKKNLLTDGFKTGNSSKPDVIDLSDDEVMETTDDISALPPASPCISTASANQSKPITKQDEVRLVLSSLSIIDSIMAFFETVLRNELKVAYGSQWTTVAKIKPPWNQCQIMGCMKACWASVFRFVFVDEYCLTLLDKQWRFLSANKWNANSMSKQSVPPVSQILEVMQRFEVLVDKLSNRKEYIDQFGPIKTACQHCIKAMNEFLKRRASETDLDCEVVGYVVDSVVGAPVEKRLDQIWMSIRDTCNRAGSKDLPIQTVRDSVDICSQLADVMHKFLRAKVSWDPGEHSYAADLVGLLNRSISFFKVPSSLCPRLIVSEITSFCSHQNQTDMMAAGLEELKKYVDALTNALHSKY